VVGKHPTRATGDIARHGDPEKAVECPAFESVGPSFRCGPGNNRP